LRDAASKKILLEVALLKAIEARKAISLDAVLKRLQDLRSEKGSDVVSLPAPTAAPVSAPKPFQAQASAPTAPAVSSVAPKAAPAPAATVAPAAVETLSEPAAAASNLDELWARLLELVGRASPFTRSYLLEAHPVSFVKNIFTIGFAQEFEEHIGLVDNSKNHALLQTKLSELGHPRAQIKFIKAEPSAEWKAATAVSVPAEEPAPAPAASQTKSAPTAPPKAATPAPAPAKEKPASISFSKDDFKNDPLIQKALEIFKGTIVEVRA
jgi:DNA polymerase-3 subunit gamma/tau